MTREPRRPGRGRGRGRPPRDPGDDTAAVEAAEMQLERDRWAEAAEHFPRLSSGDQACGGGWRVMRKRLDIH